VVSAVNRVWVVVAVAVGGALGTMVRYELALAEPVGSGHFPWATFTVNIVGSFVLGFAATALVETWRPSRILRPFVAVGFCGGLTTFSTWMVESVLLVRDDQAGLAVVYLVVSLAVGVLAVSVGMLLARAAMHRTIPPFDPRGDD
jgi:fluoride exporter